MSEKTVLREYFSDKSLKIFDTVNESLLIINNKNEIVFCNEYIKKLFSLKDQDIKGKIFNREFCLFCSPDGELLCEDSNPVDDVFADGNERNFTGFINLQDKVITCDFQVFALMDDEENNVELVVIIFSENNTYHLEKENQKLREILLTDEKTGAHNKKYLQAFVDSKIEEYRRYGSEFGLIMLRLAEFGKLKEKYGEKNIDKILETVAGTLITSTRKFDIVARYSEDSFMIVIVNSSESKLLSIASRYINLANKLHISVVMGVTEYRDGDETEAILGRVEKYCDEAEIKGNNSYKSDVKE